MLRPFIPGHAIANTLALGPGAFGPGRCQGGLTSYSHIDRAATLGAVLTLLRVPHY